MTPDYRALCAELATTLAERIDDKGDAGPYYTHAARLAARARALLAEPEPEGPTDEELDELFTEIDQSGEALSWRLYARAALARWGHPTPQPVAVSERLPSAADCDVEDNCWWFDPHADGAWYVDTFQSCYTHWLPANALPTPEATND